LVTPEFCYHKIDHLYDWGKEGICILEKLLLVRTLTPPN
jgi:hypothetical protein